MRGNMQRRYNKLNVLTFIVIYWIIDLKNKIEIDTFCRYKLMPTLEFICDKYFLY